MLILKKIDIVLCLIESLIASGVMNLLCYESLMGISKLAKKSAIKELDEIAEDKMEDAFQKCKKCKYSELTD